MSLFMILSGAMVLLALALVLVPLLRGVPQRHSARESLVVLSDRARELEAERAAGMIDAQEYLSARRELERQALESEGIAGRGSALDVRGRWSAALAIAVGLPVTAILLYAMVGQPQALLAVHAPPSVGGAAHERTESAIATLARRLEQDDGDGEGWILLARSWLQLERIPESLGAYRKAVAILPGNADLLVEYANTLAIANQRRLAGEPEELAERALQIDPDNFNALAFAGLAALQRQDRTLALQRWRRLEALLPDGSDDRRRIAALIAQAEGGQGAQAQGLAGADSSRPEVARAGGEQVTVTAGKAHPVFADATHPPTGESIRGTVTLAGPLAGRVAPTDTLFVFARAIDGPPMPLAAVRARAGDLPLYFTLDDGSAMVQGMSLSKFPRVDIVARISRHGTPTAQTGDIEGSARGVAVGSSGLQIMMDRVVGR